MQKEEDYFIPALAPYVEWVRVYRSLISELYREHKTVRRAWKAFKEAIPGIEHRLPFGVFEQILLFSLFLSEWNETSIVGGSDEKTDKAASGITGDRGIPHGSELDTVIQTIQQITAETDKVLVDLNLCCNQNAQTLRDQQERLETRMASLDKSLETFTSEMNVQDEHLERVIQEIIAGVQRQRLIEAGKKVRNEGLIQTTMQWDGPRGDHAVRQNTEPTAPLKKIGGWNAQRSRDGYYRLYRKIGGRVHSIYIGKELDVAKAEKKIAERERELLRAGNVVETNRRMDISGQMKMERRSRIIGVPEDDN
jgi:hypothetical protein